MHLIETARVASADLIANLDKARDLSTRNPAARYTTPALEISLTSSSSDTDDGRVFLSTALPSRCDWLLARSVALISLLAFAAIVPFAKVQLPVTPAFITAYESALLINDLITAILLFGQFTILRSRALLVLAGGYLFSALMAVPHALTFPGVFALHGLLGAGAQTTSWLYISWHMLFPLVVVAYALLKQTQGLLATTRSPSVAVTCTVLVTVGAITVLTLVSILAEPALPPILLGIHYTPTAIFSLAFAGGLNLLSIVVLWLRRPHTVLDLWLMVVMCAWLFDVGLSAVLNNGRYDLGFYAGRIYVLLGASFVLAVMLVQTTRLYSRLAGRAQRLTDYAGTLEASVRARTIELQRSNEALQSLNEALTNEITERKQAEAQLVQAQKMEAIGNLTGGMAHDFNNHLAIIIGNLDLLSQFKKDHPEQDELLQEALDAAINGADLTRRLLAFARRQPLQPERIEVNELVDRITKLLTRTLGEQIEIKLELDPKTPPIIADPAQLETAITNLANNARDAMPKGGKLTLATGKRHLDAEYAAEHIEVEPGGYTMIEVSDTGSGMSPETVAHIFEPFFTTKELGKGTGLGLSMVFGFLKQSGGHIEVYSEPGRGTAFRLYLRSAEPADAVAVAPAAVERFQGGGETILIVEDNSKLRQILRKQLDDLCYRVVEAESARAALDLLEGECAIDLLLTDVVMPGEMDGCELARAFMARRPESAVLLTSGFPGSRLIDEAGLGASVPLLSKPHRREDLARSVRQALDHQLNAIPVNEFVSDW